MTPEGRCCYRGSLYLFLYFSLLFRYLFGTAPVVQAYSPHHKKYPRFLATSPTFFFEYLFGYVDTRVLLYDVIILTSLGLLLGGGFGQESFLGEESSHRKGLGTCQVYQ